MITLILCIIEMWHPIEWSFNVLENYQPSGAVPQKHRGILAHYLCIVLDG